MRCCLLYFKVILHFLRPHLILATGERLRAKQRGEKGKGCLWRIGELEMEEWSCQRCSKEREKRREIVSTKRKERKSWIKTVFLLFFLSDRRRPWKQAFSCDAKVVGAPRPSKLEDHNKNQRLFFTQLHNENPASVSPTTFLNCSTKLDRLRKTKNNLQIPSSLAFLALKFACTCLTQTWTNPNFHPLKLQMHVGERESEKERKRERVKKGKGEREGERMHCTKEFASGVQFFQLNSHNKRNHLAAARSNGKRFWNSNWKA